MQQVLLIDRFGEKLGNKFGESSGKIFEAGLLEPVFEYNKSFFVTLFDKTKAYDGTVEKTVGKTVEKTVESIMLLIKSNPQITTKELANEVKKDISLEGKKD